MSLVTSKQMLLNAQEQGYAVPAFNVENMEMVQAVIAGAEEMNSPVILQTTPSTLKYASPELFFANVNAVAKNASIPVALHLDHGNSFELAMKTFRAGYTSIMIDGSALSFEDNIKLAKKVVEVCHSTDIPVEAELGKVGGKEDDLIASNQSPYTDPIQAKIFVKETNVDFLAVAIGTAHGVYKGLPKIDKKRLAEIKAVVAIPLVLHGTSGVPEQDVKDCIKLGVCKVNYATDLRIAFSNGVKQYLSENPNEFDPKKYNSVGREFVKNDVIQKIQLVGSNNKANEVF